MGSNVLALESGAAIAFNLQTIDTDGKRGKHELPLLVCGRGPHQRGFLGGEDDKGADHGLTRIIPNLAADFRGALCADVDRPQDEAQETGELPEIIRWLHSNPPTPTLVT